jgi:hypothetical protein
MRMSRVSCFALSFIAAVAMGQSNKNKSPYVPVCGPNTRCSRICPQNCQPVDLTVYFVPSYAGWQTARRVWTGAGGGQDSSRWFSYAPGKYEFIKTANGTKAETYTVYNDYIRITSEQGGDITNSSVYTRVWINAGAIWMPASPTPPIQFLPCSDGTVFYNSSCQPTGSQGSSCAKNYSSVYRIGSYNYGYSVGVVDSIEKEDVLDNGDIEEYFYGLHRGLLRWEYWLANGTLKNWSQQIDEIADSPIADHICFRP